MKDLLRCPKDEENWGKLQQLREVVLLIVQGIRTFTLESAEEAYELKGAICCGHLVDPSHYTSIGSGTWIPPGSRIHLDEREAQHIKDTVRKKRSASRLLGRKDQSLATRDSDPGADEAVWYAVAPARRSVRQSFGGQAKLIPSVRSKGKAAAPGE